MVKKGFTALVALLTQQILLFEHCIKNNFITCGNFQNDALCNLVVMVPNRAKHLIYFKYQSPFKDDSIWSVVILGKCPLAHHFFICYYLVSFDLYAQRILHHVSKHNLILRTNQFIDVRRKKWGELTILSKSSTVIFITISAWCQSLWIFRCNGFRKWLNHRFPMLRKACSGLL